MAKKQEKIPCCLEKKEISYLKIDYVHNSQIHSESF